MVETDDDRDRADTGEYVETVGEAEALEAVRDGGHIVTAGEVAEAINTSRDTALRRLGTLHDAGRVERKDVGSGTVWWPAESGSRETDEDRSHESL